MIDIGSRLELFVDGFLIEKMDGAELALHAPEARNIALDFDRPWEGNTCCYVTVFQDGQVFRMYYRGTNHDFAGQEESHEAVVCLAESPDGIKWSRPDLGLFEFGGSKQNNIVWMGTGSHNFAPFKDTNPDARPEALYKALGSSDSPVGLAAFASPDAIHWSLMQRDPVITKGAFDSQNLAFWDSLRGHYVAFFRDFRNDVRDVKTCTSHDFVNWTEPQWLDYGDAPPEHLYTNAIVPYLRAPHIFLGFPKRFLRERKRILDHADPGVSDGLFMTSRDGLHWHRWTEAFIRPGLQPERWVNRNNMTAWGTLATKSDVSGMPEELSVYSTENYYSMTGPCRLRRFALRMDGFVSAHAPYAGGEFTTRPLIFEGHELVINYSTSAAGSIRVEVADTDGKPIPGFELEKCPGIYGDDIERAVEWEDGEGLDRLAGRPVRLRFVLKDADLFSMRFRP